jgi:hypothetical protein
MKNADRDGDRLDVKRVLRLQQTDPQPVPRQ